MSLTETIWEELMRNKKQEDQQPEQVVDEKEDFEKKKEEAIKYLDDEIKKLMQDYEYDFYEINDRFYICRMLRELRDSINNGSVDINDVKINISYKKNGVKRHIKYIGKHRGLFWRYR